MRSIILCVILFCSLFVSAQLNFEQIEQQYLQSIQGIKASELDNNSVFKKYVRWKYYAEPRSYGTPQWTNPQGSGRAFEGNWAFIGPTYYSTGNINSYAPGVGRIDVIRFQPGNDNIIYAGTPTGGLWKSTDAGLTWNCLTDTLQINSLGVADLVIDPNNTDHMWLATGDGDTPTFSMSIYGVGIWESFDAGDTWQPTNFGYQVDAGMWITRLLMHPTNPLIQYAAGNPGIFKTTDGWQTGSLVAPVADWQDMEFQPGNPDYVYAVSQTGIYKSTFGGNSFVQKVALNNVYKARMAVTPANPNKVFVCAGTLSALDNVYMSTDLGENYTTLTYDGDILRMDLGSGYYVGSNTLDINVSPVDEDLIYVGSGNVYRYDTNVWTKLVTSDIFNINEEFMHGDIHVVWFNSTGQLYIGCDGGFYRKDVSQNLWTDISDGMGVTQIYKIGAHDSTSTRLNIGTQDCGQMEYRSSGDWEQVAGSDGWNSYYHLTDVNTWYTSNLFGHIYKTTDGGNTLDTIMNPYSPNFSTGSNFLNFRRISPFIMHPQQPDVLYIAYDDVYRSNNGGINWQRRSTLDKDLRSMAVSYTDPNTWYVATTTQLWYTATNGSTMILRNINTGGAPITDIAVDPANQFRLWVTASGFISGEKVYYSNDGGFTWTNISAGLPNMPVNCIVYVRDSDDELYVGTDIGVYVKNNTTGNWQYFGDMLPSIVTYDLAVDYTNSKIRAGTFGRGLWESDLYTPLVVSAPGQQAKPVADRLTVYPNPTQGEVTIDLRNPNEQLIRVNVTDMAGRVVLRFGQAQLTNNRIDLHKLSKGQYLLVIGTNRARYKQALLVE